jgi:Flp pilus assembly protein TadD
MYSFIPVPLGLKGMNWAPEGDKDSTGATMRISFVLSCFLLNACVHHRVVRLPPTDHVELDILRSHPGAEKLYVQARLPDGQQGLFMVDTGAGVTAITQALADRLEIKGEDTGRFLQGLGGETPLIRGTLQELDLKGLRMGPIDVAIGVPGIPTHAGWMPVDGILGNNVWGQLVLGIDYPADILELSRPGVVALPETAQEVFFDGRHMALEVEITAGDSSGDGEGIRKRTLHLELDTGARGILLSGSAGEGFEEISTEGEEPIFGVGASEDVPVSAFYRRTRHVPILSVSLGGVTIDTPLTATWINYGQGTHVGPQDLNGLIGHSVVANHKLLIDFPNRKMALVPSLRPPRQNNGHATLLLQDVKKHRRNKDRGLFRAQMLLAQDQGPEAESQLHRFLKKNPDHGEALSLLARIHRTRGDIDGYLSILEKLSPEKLARAGELVSAVNTLLVGGKVTEAVALVKEAVVLAPDEPGAFIALFELYMHQGKLNDARLALKEARRLKENPDAFLMRRSRLALREKDIFGTVSHLRRRLALYPSDGFALWAYSLTYPKGRQYHATFDKDMNGAMNRLHPDSLPLDFFAAALFELGDLERSAALTQAGIERDCNTAEPPQEKSNCLAWYYAMGHTKLDQAVELVNSALALDPFRPDFLDTKAVIQLQRGNLAEAEMAATEAVRLKPADVYHLWQLDRIRVIRSAERSSQ